HGAPKVGHESVGYGDRRKAWPTMLTNVEIRALKLILKRVERRGHHETAVRLRSFPKIARPHSRDTRGPAGSRQAESNLAPF
ncbi:hypothetical protein, partial [Morganella morganii]|uniref:hypothetical protein n=1 Tax=Morganella morganii TaxID=582 RepID=UPI002367CF61